MNAAWATVAIATIMALASVAAWVFRAGKRDGKLDTILERLTDVSEDHEGRLRRLEHDRPAAQ